MNLYEIAGNIRELADMAGELDDDTIRDTLESLTGDLTEKADSIGKLSKMLTRQAEACNLEATRLKDRAAKLEKRNESILSYLQACMVVADVKRVENSLFNISIRKMPPVVQLDEELLPKKWLVERITYAPDKRGIKAAIEAGTDVRGATLVTGREKLYIR